MNSGVSNNEIIKEEFHKVRDRIVGIQRERYGIGTLAEKTLHNILKNYYSNGEDYQEIPINEFVADIYMDGHIIEIQTGNFNKLRRKLDSFLPEYKVTIVYPLVNTRYLTYIDKDTGTMSPKRKSTRKDTYYTAFKELYKIKMYLNHPNLSLKLVMLEADEYKLESGNSRSKRRRAEKYDIVPRELIDEMNITRPEDFIQLIPVELEDEFTAKDFSKAAKIHISYGQLILNIFNYLGIVNRVGKSGNSYIYEVK